MDVVFLDRNGKVAAVHRNVRPWRLAFGPKTSHAVVEVVARAADVQPGEMLRLECGNRGTTFPKAVAFLAWLGETG